MRLSLRLVGRFRDVDTDEGFDSIFSVNGMTMDDYCLVTYAGSPDGHRRRWAVSWYRSGRRLSVLADADYDSPEAALDGIRQALEPKREVD